MKRPREQLVPLLNALLDHAVAVAVHADADAAVVGEGSRNSAATRRGAANHGAGIAHQRLPLKAKRQ